ncbi:energy-coupling factor transporter ATPase [Sporolituus thermophilus]|uniref:Energy-coupling factor transporter ATP-binding protein EcfA2 n=1 Tax=Sporolituus thermophilus DSM 23256 TaxID=1123285 RepID=A0A1G7LNW8_9FIRM|nr:energy-coupling factor transporter ATPase [Sporolituus thermophilus]SDF51113.1 energy-coupling factor transport system ATP-binding protein [Sporolituus thermophilus DSM 23256]
MSLTLKNVTYTYMVGTPYEQTALKDISLEINRGEFVGIIGHTGSGKSTLVQHLSGLLAPTRGEVALDGVSLHAKTDAARQARRKVGLVFQYPEHQLFEETIYDDIAFGPRNLGLAEEEVEQRVRRAMAFVGLNYEDYARRSPFRLSGGQMRRVAIAGVIALQPEFLILDEPSAGLDPRGRDDIFGRIVELHRATGTTVILVSHNMEDVARMASRLLVMDHGRVVLDGPPLALFREGREILRVAGVDVPPVTALLLALRQRGLPVDDTALTPQAAAQAIATACRRRKPC